MSAPPPLLPVDLERLHDITNGETLIIQELADDYFLQSIDIIREMERAIQSQSVEAIKKLTHKFRGSSATFGITTVKAPIEKIEQSITESDFESASRSLRETYQKLEEARMFIKTYLV